LGSYGRPRAACPSARAQRAHRVEHEVSEELGFAAGGSSASSTSERSIPERSDLEIACRASHTCLPRHHGGRT
jgi:hypothetical protein